MERRKNERESEGWEVRERVVIERVVRDTQEHRVNMKGL